MPFTVLDVRLSLGRIVLLCHDTVAERGGGGQGNRGRLAFAFLYMYVTYKSNFHNKIVTFIT